MTEGNAAWVVDGPGFWERLAFACCVRPALVVMGAAMWLDDRLRGRTRLRRLT